MRPTFIIAAASGVAALLTFAGQAQAQNNRSFVSGHGQDANPCTLAVSLGQKVNPKFPKPHSGLGKIAKDP